MHETLDTLRVLGPLVNPKFDNLQTRYQIQSCEYLKFTQRDHTYYI